MPNLIGWHMVAWSNDTEAAWELHVAELTRIPGVREVSTGVRTRNGKQTRERTVVVTVTRKLPKVEISAGHLVPPMLRLPDGKTVGTDVVEDVSSVYTPDQDSSSYRPVAGGCEIQPVGSAFLGTLGGWFGVANRADPGWTPTWLTNAHVAAPATFSAIPADPRVRQPAGGGIIGDTVGISGWPNPLPGPMVTVGGVCDAAIGELHERVEADLQVVDIGPAPFEIGTAAGGMEVQKRGRTTRLRTGEVVNQAGGNPWVAVNINSPAGGLVTFGLPGQPRVFRVDSPRAGVGAAFGMPGDSGSLVFATRAGELRDTVPCVGLYFAGNGRWVSEQPDPDAHTVRGFAFDITNVMGQFDLITVCAGMVRSLLAAIFGSGSTTADRAELESVARRTTRAERMMRAFRDDILARSTVGKTIAEAVAQTAPEVSQVLTTDPVAYGLTVELLEPWAQASTSLTVLNRDLDQRTVALAVELAELVVRRAPNTKDYVAPLVETLKKMEGQPVRKLIGSFRSPSLPKNLKNPAKRDDGGDRKKK